MLFVLTTLTGAVVALTGWTPRRPVKSRRAEIALGVGAGAVLGSLLGFIGRGCGGMIAPVLLLAGCEPRAAAAPSSAIAGFASTRLRRDTERGPPAGPGSFGETRSAGLRPA